MSDIRSFQVPAPQDDGDSGAGPGLPTGGHGRRSVPEPDAARTPPMGFGTSRPPWAEPGEPHLPGQEGQKPGAHSTPGSHGTHGAPGTPGSHGTHGTHGTHGPHDASAGSHGTPGPPGTPGSHGTPGAPGSHGVPGSHGSRRPSWPEPPGQGATTFGRSSRHGGPGGDPLAGRDATRPGTHDDVRDVPDMSPGEVTEWGAYPVYRDTHSVEPYDSRDPLDLSRPLEPEPVPQSSWGRDDPAWSQESSFWARDDQSWGQESLGWGQEGPASPTAASHGPDPHRSPASPTPDPYADPRTPASPSADPYAPAPRTPASHGSDPYAAPRVPAPRPDRGAPPAPPPPAHQPQTGAHPYAVPGAAPQGPPSPQNTSPQGASPQIAPPPRRPAAPGERPFSYWENSAGQGEPSFWSQGPAAEQERRAEREREQVTEEEPAPPARKKREPYLDNVKFVLIALVVTGHSLVPTLKAHSAEAAYLFIYMFHMPAFVLISGYLGRNFWNSNAKINKLVDTLLIPYVVVEIGYALLRFSLGQKWTLTIIDPAWLNWYLLALVLWRISTPIWTRMRQPLLVAVVIYMAAGFSEISGDFSIDRFFGLLPFYVLGLLLKPEHFDLLKPLWVRITSAVVLVAAAGVAIVAAPRVPLDPVYFRYSFKAMDMSWWLGFGVRAAVLVAALVMTFAVLALVPRRETWFSDLGTRTLYAYLLHGVVVVIAKDQGWLSFPWLYGPLGVAAIASSSLALAIVLCLPETRRLFKWMLEPRLVWLYRRPSPAPARAPAETAGTTGPAGPERPAGSTGPDRPTGPGGQESSAAVPR
ncbi:acyltransferase family protein [Streptosporangium sp. DT93]|uniref:acyltransferase family protein n=1 Tax=Streptosporangium sp. DT93 TaxID=3393428 RepID=UPI003CF2B86B